MAARDESVSMCPQPASPHETATTVTREMPRLPRYLLPVEGVYHVTARGVARCAISHDDDRRFFLALLARAVRRADWTCHAFCLMPNHYHVVVETVLERLSRGLHRLNGDYAQAFNQRHGRSGHLFGDRFAAFAIRDDEHLRQACEYVLQNPVRAGLCERAADWRWGGYR
jgi:putative transposase